MDESSSDNIPSIQDQLAVRREVQQRFVMANEELDSEVYRFDMIVAELELAESELHKLESLSITGIVSSLFGTKPGKLDALREEIENLNNQEKNAEHTVQG